MDAQSGQRALYSAAMEGRDNTLEKFERDLKVTDPTDRPLIVDLLNRSGF